MEIADIKICDTWTEYGGQFSPSAWEEFTEIVKPFGLTVSATPVDYPKTLFVKDIPLIFVPSSLFYYPERTVGQLGEKIETAAEKNEPPVFIIVYGILHDIGICEQLSNYLDLNLYKIVRLDELVSLAKLYNSTQWVKFKEKKVTCFTGDKVKSELNFTIPEEEKEKIVGTKIKLEMEHGFKTIPDSLKITSDNLTANKLEFEIVTPKSSKKKNSRIKVSLEKNITDNPDYCAVKLLDQNDLLLCNRAKEPKKIDGILSDWENEKVYQVTEENQLLRGKENWKGPKDASFLFHISWDESNFYLAADVTDNTFFQQQLGESIWQGDCLMLFFKWFNKNDSLKKFFITLTPKGPIIWNVRLNKESNGSKLIVVQKPDKNGLLVEVSIPWEELNQKGNELENQLTYFNIGYGDYDDNRENCYIDLNGQNPDDIDNNKSKFIIFRK